MVCSVIFVFSKVNFEYHFNANALVMKASLTYRLLAYKTLSYFFYLLTSETRVESILYHEYSISKKKINHKKKI